MKKNKEYIAYFLLITLCIVFLVLILNLWNSDIRIPFSYGGDGISVNAIIKGIFDNGWFLNNDYLGAPFSQLFYDYPISESFHFIALLFIGIFTKNYVIAFNVYYLVSYILISISTFYVLRHFHVTRFSAIMASILYAFMPYHLLRGEAHYFLSAYYMVPLIMMVILWIYTEQKLLFNYNIKDNKLRFLIRNKKSIASLIISVILASSGIYYAYFACFLLLVVGISMYISKKSLAQLLNSLVVICFITFTLLINLIPNLIYWLENGKNLGVGNRSPIEAEYYGMKLTQLFLPVNDHGIEPLKKLISSYANSPLLNEGTEYLGIIGILGFTALLLQLFMFKFKDNYNNILLNRLSYLNVSSILLATIGGFGSIVAFLFVPEIRGYNRISIYIAFFALFASAIYIDKVLNAIKSKKTKFIVYVLITIFSVVTLLEQSVSFAPNYKVLKQDYMNDKDFITKIESELPQESMIFQLPYVPFPEHPPVNYMGDYELYRGYLHSKNFHWSYGVIKGREWDGWQQYIHQLPLTEMVEAISLVGFNGLYIDRLGYEDFGEAIIKNLSDILNTSPMEDNNKRLVFFNLLDYNNQIENKYPVIEYEKKKNEVLYPILFNWNSGFSGLEGTRDDNWRWSSSEGNLYISNFSEKEQTIKIVMNLSTGYSDFSRIDIESDLFSERLQINSKETLFSKVIVVPPGKHKVQFISQAPRVIAPNDPRDLVFKVVNFRFDYIR